MCTILLDIFTRFFHKNTKLPTSHIQKWPHIHVYLKMAKRRSIAPISPHILSSSIFALVDTKFSTPRRIVYSLTLLIPMLHTCHCWRLYIIVFHGKQIDFHDKQFAFHGPHLSLTIGNSSLMENKLFHGTYLPPTTHNRILRHISASYGIFASHDKHSAFKAYTPPPWKIFAFQDTPLPSNGTKQINHQVLW